jgi:hypothetical protein
MLKLQVGAGLDGPVQWLNVDASPTLRLQRLPVLGSLQRYLHSDVSDRASDFLRATLLGLERRERGVTGALRSWIGNSQHLWLWDYRSIEHRLAEAGFTAIRRAAFNDSSESAFAEVENPDRWQDCLGFECRKPGG